LIFRFGLTFGEERMAMESEEILGIDIHDAIMGLKRAVGMKRLVLRSPFTISALDRVRLGADGRVDPATVGPEVRAAARAYIGMHPDDWATR
jgi:hypothetical protein